MTLNSYKLPVPAASSLALKRRSTEGNTLTGPTNLLRSAIQQQVTVHLLFCIVTLVVAGATLLSAQSASVVVHADSQHPKLPAVKGVSPTAKEEAPTAPPKAPATARLQFPNSDVVD